MPPRADLRLAAVSLVGLVVVATTGCVWLLFDRTKMPPCHSFRIVDLPSLYEASDKIIWAWLQRKEEDGQVYVGYDGNDEKVAEELGRYRKTHRGANTADYFISLGMSCQPYQDGLVCRRQLTAHYYCAQPHKAGVKPVRYEGEMTVTVRIEGTGKLRISSGIKGKGGPLWPPDRPPVRQ
jgi:hypothetical protein